ncbi:iron chelate uptake ABC transporter family permease subunit [Neolewinella lacunae]|uniref:Metal ABC transporter permease n=1 Tax=Neolewinella lacunae TaxID=1517758 RepID=A0A923T6S4_9BACT|nr:iron chelate uptake ABC transporter family permease subunit [Neolewinella lacunae]MBC6992891.1 metal ABC transporter permease [Neolewinella lacunae]MDN3633745.1 iron chelate uptake ABC transporter family permease subunit [Neolewinella lacunae]
MSEASLFEILSEVWALRAIVASSMVGLMCGVLGCFIVLRNMSLVGDALAHAILPGVVVAYMIAGYSTLAFFSGAVAAGLLTAFGITWIQQRVKTKNDAAVGIVFTSMFSLGVILISRISREDGVHLDLKDFLFGYALGVSDTDLLLTALVMVYVLLSVVVFYRYLFAATFQSVVAETMGIPVRLLHYFLMLLLSFAVVASLQTVGVILVVAMLITPAATALLLAQRLQAVLVIAGFIGMLSAIVGMVVAVWLNTPPGPAMALVATGIYALTVVFAPTRGMLARAYFRYQRNQLTLREDILKRVYGQNQQLQQADAQAIRSELDLSDRQWQRQLTTLRGKGLLEKADLNLTDGGKLLALRLIRAHRLWETYLNQEVGLTPDQIHEEAERLEHLLTEEMLDRVDAELGYPETDPHGSVIPGKEV